MPVLRCLHKDKSVCHNCDVGRTSDNPIVIWSFTSHTVLSNNSSTYECRGKSIFVINAGTYSSGAILRISAANSLDDCINLCNSMSNQCRAVSLTHQNTNRPPLCTLFEAINKDCPWNEQMNKNASSLYSAEKFCLPIRQTANAFADCEGSWHFQQIANKQAIGSSLFIINMLTGYSAEECLAECVKLNHICRAVQYHKPTKQCSLLSINRQVVHKANRFFTDAHQTIIYENSCFKPGKWFTCKCCMFIIVLLFSILAVPKNQVTCQFEETTHYGIPILYDERTPNIESSEQCQKLCLTSKNHLCSAYMFNRRLKVCHLSHTGVDLQPQQQQQLLHHTNSYDGVVLGRLENCIELKMTCKLKSMHIHMTSLKMIDEGKLYSLQQSNKNSKTTLRNSWTASLEIPYEKCATNVDDSQSRTYLNTVAFSRTYETAENHKYDRRVNLVCKSNAQEENSKLNVKLRVLPPPNPLNDQKIFNIKGNMNENKHPFKLTIVDKNYRPVKNVQAGDTGYLEVQYNSDGAHRMPDDFRIVDFIATDLREGNDLLLFNQHGCNTQPSLVGKFFPVNKQMKRSKIVFFAFPETKRVYYKGHVEACYKNCDQWENECRHNDEQKPNLSRKQKRDVEIFKISSSAENANYSTGSVLLYFDEFEMLTCTSALLFLCTFVSVTWTTTPSGFVEEVSCNSRSMIVVLNKSDPDVIQWRRDSAARPVVYVYGHKERTPCGLFLKSPDNSTYHLNFTIPYGPVCSVQLTDLEPNHQTAETSIAIEDHASFAHSKPIRIHHVFCIYTKLIASTGGKPKPKVQLLFRDPSGKPMRAARFGDQVGLYLMLDPDNAYKAINPKHCVFSDRDRMEEPDAKTLTFIQSDCPVDELGEIVEPVKDVNEEIYYTKFQAFRFGEKPTVYAHCTVEVCLEQESCAKTCFPKVKNKSITPEILRHRLRRSNYPRVQRRIRGLNLEKAEPNQQVAVSSYLTVLDEIQTSEVIAAEPPPGFEDCQSPNAYFLFLISVGFFTVLFLFMGAAVIYLLFKLRANKSKDQFGHLPFSQLSAPSVGTLSRGGTPSPLWTDRYGHKSSSSLALNRPAEIMIPRINTYH
ncbi:Protein dyf-8 [Trichinella pseudospiralis]|uniref:Protein dyf-8 n=1 Tax=Trichinella pseudospiralis TaxID=6337 RepID=A0A0V1JPL8_TRIPS|nr:Protein dyf-8 [Trichinella pseudospiralis]